MVPVISTDAQLGIGQATAISFAREGCKKVAIADQNAKGLEETAKLMTEAATDGKIYILREQTNVIDEIQVSDLLDAVVQQLGRVDYCANCAGTNLLVCAFVDYMLRAV